MNDETWDQDHDDDGPDAVDDRTLLVQVNARSWRAAAEGLLDRAGDLDFSGQPRLDGCYDEDRLPTLAEASGIDQPEAPGGYEVLVLRRAYLDERGRTVDTAVAVLSVSEPQPFFEAPTVRGVDPDIDRLIRATGRAERLDRTLEQAPISPDPSVRRPRM